MKTYDAIIIGTGIGGAAVGALLARAGWKVLILDKNKTVGGRCTSYEYKGFTLDLGVHLFGVGDKGSLGDILRATSTPDAIEWVKVTKTTQQVGDAVRKYSQKAMMSALPAEEQNNLNDLFAKAHHITDDELVTLWRVPVENWINTFTTNPLAHAFLNSIVHQYFCVPSREASAAEFIQCFREVLSSRSSAYPKGGCIAIPRAYLSVVEANGGDVRMQAAATRIIVEKGAAVGVCMEDGAEFRAPVVISNADIKATVERLVGEEYFPADYVEKMRNLTYADSCVMFKIGLKEPVTDDQLRMYLPNEKTTLGNRFDEYRAGKIPDKVSGMIVVPTNFDASLGPEGRQLICFGTSTFTDADFNRQDWKKWYTTLRDSLYSAYPEAKGKVLWEKMDTPQLVDAYAGEAGNIIGVGQTVQQIHTARPTVESPLKGLYFCSAEAGGHGIGTELAASSAKELFAALTRV